MADTRRRWAFKVGLVSLSWVAIVATSQPRWRVTASASAAPFVLVGQSAAAQSFRVTVRPSTAVMRATSGRWVTIRLNVAARGAIDGTPRPAALRVDVAEEGGNAGLQGMNGTATHTRSRDCASAHGCVPSYLVTVRWPDAPANARATVACAINAEVEATGDSNTPAGARVELTVSEPSVP